MVVRSYQSSASDSSAAPEFRPVVTRRAFEEIVLQFEEAVLSGQLRVGQKLPPERELAEQLGVSRASLREALRVLEMMGVVSAKRGSGERSGSYIDAGQNGLAGLLPLYAKLRAVPLSDLVDVRVAIERMTASGAANDGANAARALGATTQEMHKATTHGAFLAADTRFHHELARCSGNSLAPFLMESIREAIAREMLAAFRRSKAWKTERDRLVSEHEGIRTFVAAGDATGAASAVERHIRDFYARSTVSKRE